MKSVLVMTLWARAISWKQRVRMVIHLSRQVVTKRALLVKRGALGGNTTIASTCQGLCLLCEQVLLLVLAKDLAILVDIDRDCG